MESESFDSQTPDGMVSLPAKYNTATVGRTQISVAVNQTYQTFELIWFDLI
jgi:hypothetical protein